MFSLLRRRRPVCWLLLDISASTMYSVSNRTPTPKTLLDEMLACLPDEDKLTKGFRLQVVPFDAKVYDAHDSLASFQAKLGLGREHRKGFRRSGTHIGAALEKVRGQCQLDDRVLLITDGNPLNYEIELHYEVEAWTQKPVTPPFMLVIINTDGASQLGVLQRLVSSGGGFAALHSEAQIRNKPGMEHSTPGATKAAIRDFLHQPRRALSITPTIRAMVPCDGRLLEFKLLEPAATPDITIDGITVPVTPMLELSAEQRAVFLQRLPKWSPIRSELLRIYDSKHLNTFEDQIKGIASKHRLDPEWVRQVIINPPDEEADQDAQSSAPMYQNAAVPSGSVRAKAKDVPPDEEADQDAQSSAPMSQNAAVPSEPVTPTAEDVLLQRDLIGLFIALLGPADMVDLSLASASVSDTIMEFELTKGTFDHLLASEFAVAHRGYLYMLPKPRLPWCSERPMFKAAVQQRQAWLSVQARSVVRQAVLAQFRCDLTKRKDAQSQELNGPRTTTEVMSVTFQMASGVNQPKPPRAGGKAFCTAPPNGPNPKRDDAPARPPLTRKQIRTIQYAFLESIRAGGPSSMPPAQPVGRAAAEAVGAQMAAAPAGGPNQPLLERAADDQGQARQCCNMSWQCSVQ